MSLRLRQICLVAANLQATERQLREVLDLTVCHRDPAVARWGLENILCPVGFSFLEVVAPTKNGTAAGRFLQRRGGDGGYMIILQTTDAQHLAYKARVQKRGVRIAHEMDYGDFHGMQLHPRDVGAAILEIDRNDPDPEDPSRPDQPWHPAGGTSWRKCAPSTSVIGFRAAELQSPKPEQLAQHWADILDRPLAVDAHARPALHLDDATLRFVEALDGRGEGLAGLDLGCRDVNAVLERAADAGLEVEGDVIHLCGMRLKMIQGA